MFYMESFLQFFASFFVGVLIVEPFSFQPGSTLAQLQAFIEEKNSPIPAQELIKYDNWPMVLAVSAAESGYGKHMTGEFNAWGIKDFRKGSEDFGITRNFESWNESVKYASELLYKYDPEDGMPSARAMVGRWKYVPPYQHWINNVNYALFDIERNVSFGFRKPSLLLPFS